MNERIKELLEDATDVYDDWKTGTSHREVDYKIFAELIIEECRNVVSKVYRSTPLELCGPLLIADEEIAKHFYGVEK